MKPRPKSPHDTPIDDGVQIIADLQRQCESLRTWQAAQATKLDQREQKVATQTEELDAIRAELDADLAAQNQARKALDQARAALQSEREQFNAEKQQLAAELRRVEDLQARVELDRNELTAMRSDLDGEWTSLCRIRRANEKLASELDAERERLKQNAGPPLKLTKAA